MNTPNPGSQAAVDAGCRCPVLDNHHGQGVLTDRRGEAWFKIMSDCPLHGTGAWKDVVVHGGAD